MNNLLVLFSLEVFVVDLNAHTFVCETIKLRLHLTIFYYVNYKNLQLLYHSETTNFFQIFM